MSKPISTDQLAADLATLGVKSGDVLFIHSSFKSFGPVQDGAAGVVDALKQAVGPAGMLLMPSFNLVPLAQRADSWQIGTTPATTGYLTEFFRQMPQVVRSDHYSHSVAALGKDAEAYTCDHLQKLGNRSPWDKDPWGKAYGVGSPMNKAYEQGGRVLMLGVDYHTATYVHFVEVLYWNSRLQADPQAKYFWLNREALGAYWDAQGRVKRGMVGQAQCRLFEVRDFVDCLLDVVSQDPLPWRKLD